MDSSPTSALADRDARVATVADRSVTVADVRARVATIRRGQMRQRLPEDGTAEARRLDRWVAHLLVTEAVVLHEAAARDLPAAELGQAVLALFTEVTAEVTVSDAEVSAYYEANADRFRTPEARHVRHILLPDEDTAREVLESVAAGADMAQVARDRSTDLGTRERAGDLGRICRGQFAGAFEDAVFGACVGEVTGPVPTEFGWHILRVEQHAPAALLSLSSVQADIGADLLAAARGRAFDAWLEQRRAVLARLEPEWLHPGDPRLPDHVHRH